MDIAAIWGVGTMIQASRQIVGAEILSIEMLYTRSALQKRTTEHTEYTERVRFMNKRNIFGHWAHWKKNCHNPLFNER